MIGEWIGGRNGAEIHIYIKCFQYFKYHIGELKRILSILFVSLSKRSTRRPDL